MISAKVFAPLACLLALALPVSAQTTPTVADPTQLRPLNQDSSLLSMRGGRRLLAEASAAIQAQNYTLAVTKLQQARQVFNQISNLYQQLSASFSGIDNRTADILRSGAVDAAEQRDEATYQLALVHRAQNQPELSVPLLVQVIRSQNPTTDLGKKAYAQLLELGFVNDATSTTSTR